MKSASRKGVVTMDFSNKSEAIDKKPANSMGVAPVRPQSNGVRTSTNEQKGHKLELDHNRAMSMTGVVDVPVFTDKNITVRLNGETLLVTGQGLAVKNLDIENGKLQVTGRVSSLRYTSQATPTSFVKKIFK